MIGTIVQARMSSERLPGKSLMRLGARTVLEHVIDRVEAAEIGRIVIATSVDPSDDPIVDVAYAVGVECYRGKLDDVLSRYMGAALAFDLDPVIRVTADCPLLDVGLLQAVACEIQRGRYAYVGVKGAPDGYHAEAFTFQALALTDRLATSAYDREHVVTYMLERPAMFRLGWVKCDIPGDPVALDTAEDLERIAALL